MAYTYGEKSKKYNSNVIPFQRDASYYFQKGSYYFQKNKLEKALVYFRKTIEVEPDNSLNHYNLACLLSKMGHLEEANKIFNYIINELDPGLSECYFLMAINYGLMEDLEQAQRFLIKYLQSCPEGEMAVEARELLFALVDEEDEEEDDLSAEEREELIRRVSESSQEELTKQFQENPFFRKTLQRGLYQANDELKENIIHFYGLLKNKEAERILKEFVRNPWVGDRLRQIALLKLKNMGVNGVCQVFLEGQIREVNLQYYPLIAPEWKEEWQEVLDCTLENMRRSKYYNEDFLSDVQAMWIDFINTVYPEVPRIKKPETWAAGLEYSLARFHFLNLTQRELAGEYGVSMASVGSKFKQINQALNIEQKAYRNMLNYLQDHEDK